MMTRATSSRDVRASIARLVDVCRDAQYGFEMAARGISQEPILRAELLQYSGQRQEFVADLNEALRQAGEPPLPQASPIVESNRPACIDQDDFAALEDAVARHDRTAILSECEHAEAAVAEAYRKAYCTPLPTTLSGTIAVQLQAINRVHDRLHSLLEVADSS